MRKGNQGRDCHRARVSGNGKRNIMKEMNGQGKVNIVDEGWGLRKKRKDAQNEERGMRAWYSIWQGKGGSERWLGMRAE
jgi:hypothetical protein